MEQVAKQPIKVIVVGATEESLDRMRLAMLPHAQNCTIAFLTLAEAARSNCKEIKEATVGYYEDSFTHTCIQAQLAMQAAALKKMASIEILDLRKDYHASLIKSRVSRRARKKNGFHQARNRVICKEAYTSPRS